MIVASSGLNPFAYPDPVTPSPPPPFPFPCELARGLGELGLGDEGLGEFGLGELGLEFGRLDAGLAGFGGGAGVGSILFVVGGLNIGLLGTGIGNAFSITVGTLLGVVACDVALDSIPLILSLLNIDVRFTGATRGVGGSFREILEGWG